MITLKEYQEEAIQELLEKSKKLIEYPESKKIIFKAPTGSGKTLMVAEFLNRLVGDGEVKTSLSCIWTAPRHLHEQSKEKLENYYRESQSLKCSFFDDLEERIIGENEILFFNWESINKADNIYIRDNEQEINLSKILENTKEEGREIILIIDESHHHATTQTSKNLIKDINPKLALEVSATPFLENPDDMVVVQLDNVKREGMIKKSVAINPGFENIIKEKKVESELSKGSEELVIDIALKKRHELVNQFQDEKSDINPLILIQLPDKKTNLEDLMRERVLGILKDKHNITIENGKLAIHLAEHKENLENISRPDNEVDVLIFKQAIALGWDCPRAIILILFRDWKSVIFSIQTVGRIMRMPELRHYEEHPDLNVAYVYTNLSNIEIQEDIAKDYLTVYSSKRAAHYKPVNLESCYSVRLREKTRLSPLFIKIFLKIAKSQKLENNIDITSKKQREDIISDWKIENIDLAEVGLIKGHIAKYGLGSFDLQKIFDFFVRGHLSPFYPESRSIDKVKISIYKFFHIAFNLDYRDYQDDIIEIVLSQKNIQYFIDTIDRAKELYKQEVTKGEKELAFIKKWNIPESISFNINYHREKRKKSIMQPFFNDKKWKTEQEFIKLLEKSSNKIRWWFKNGDRDSKFFAVPYRENKELKPFYVDFIILLKDGRIGLFDTKSGITAKDAKTKAEGLSKFIKDENKKGKNLWGGIVIKVNGSWRYNDEEIYHYDKSDLSNWKSLIF